MEPVPVSVIIAARNEAAEIAACVASVDWAAEVIVVENDSTDDTFALATAAGATAFRHAFSTIGAQRNAAIARASRAWVLVVDADERGTPALGDAVRSTIDRADARAAYRTRRRNFFMGREIRHGGWERDMPIRLFRRELRYDERSVHEHVIVTEGVGVLDEALLHTPYASLQEYFEKLQRYSRWWAEQNSARGRRASVADLIVKPMARFLYMLVVRSGWRDGTHGVVLAVLGSMSVAAKYAQLWALSHKEHGS